MKVLTRVLIPSLLIASVASVTAAPKIDKGTYRVAIVADGNQHDKDDFVATPMAIALMAKAGVGSKLVHVQYNCHLGDNNSAWAKTMVTNVNGAKKRFGVSASSYDDQTSLSSATKSLKNAINASSATDRLYIAAGGPMETVWQGINASQSAKRQYVTCVSHSSWNEKHADTNQMKHTWTDVKSSGVKTTEIGDQNQTSFELPTKDWTWLKNLGGDYLWLYNTNDKKTFDASDAGMTWYIITGRGDAKASMADIKTILK